MKHIWGLQSMMVSLMNVLCLMCPSCPPEGAPLKLMTIRFDLHWLLWKVLLFDLALSSRACAPELSPGWNMVLWWMVLFDDSLNQMRVAVESRSPRMVLWWMVLWFDDVLR